MIKVLFVCLGNICRSPSGEGVFKKIVDKQNIAENFCIDSAGTSAYHVGEKADPRMRKHAKRRGYELNSRSRQFIYNDFKEFDFIIAMDHNNYKNILAMDKNNDFKDKVTLMTQYSTNYPNSDVPDPYYGGDLGFETVIDILEDSCKGFLAYIKNR